MKMIDQLSEGRSSWESGLLLPVLVTTIAIVGVLGTTSRLRGGKGFKHSSPWFLPIDIILVIRAGSTRDFVSKRKKQLQCDTFYINLVGHTVHPTLVVTTPEDQAELMRKEGKLRLRVEMPDTIKQTHGPGNMQILSGQRHQFLRKIFSSLLSPAVMESFVPLIVTQFHDMWAKLERRSEEEDGPIILQDAICDAQFLLMIKLFFGITPDTPSDKSDLDRLRVDFELQLESHFQKESSGKFQKGVAASRRIRKYLSERFAKVLELRRQQISAGQKNALPPIGNAMESIADALLRDGVADDPKVLSDVLDNLNLVLEASHGTTMTITTTIMYFLNNPNNAERLEKLRKEVSNVGEPTLTALKAEMPYAEACIKETMRMAPIVGSISYVKDEGVDIQFKGQSLSGPMSFHLSFSHNYEDASIFPEPEKFKPERWVPGNEEEVSERAKLAYKPFGMGRHMCLGYNLAIIVMKASLYCFATNAKRVVDYDDAKVKIVDGLFPERKVSDGLPGRVKIVR